MLTLSASYAEAIDRQWQQVANPGVWLNGAQRVEIATITREARNGGPVPGPVHVSAPAAEAAAVFGGDPAAPRAEWVADLERRGLDRLTYVEILSICSRVAAIDTFLYGLGMPAQPFPTPVVGEPRREVVAEARIDGGFAPTVGTAFPTTALTAVPGEQEAMFELHGALYLSIAEMGDLEIVKDLDRRQLELVAARTSLLNDCFF